MDSELSFAKNLLADVIERIKQILEDEEFVNIDELKNAVDEDGERLCDVRTNREIDFLQTITTRLTERIKLLSGEKTESVVSDRAKLITCSPSIDCVLVSKETVFLDSPDAWVCYNGVIDFTRMTFRSGKFTGKRRSCCLNYLPLRDVHKEHLMLMNRVLETTFPIETERNLFITRVISIMTSGKRDVIFYGGPSSGKTLMKSILIEMFGQYHLKLPVEMLTGNGLTGRFLKEFEPRQRGAKLIVFQDIEDINDLSEAAFKNLKKARLSMDSHYSILLPLSRSGVNGEVRGIKEFPGILQETDDIRRIFGAEACIIPFRSTFSTTPNIGCLGADPNLYEHINGLATALLSIILDGNILFEA